MKKGFTLVELLACIIILGFVVAIVAPKIFNHVKKINADLFKDNVNELLKLVKEEQIKSGSLVDITYNIDNDNISPTLNYKKGFKGKGLIMIDPDGNTYVKVGSEGLCAVKERNETTITVYELDCNEL